MKAPKNRMISKTAESGAGVPPAIQDPATVTVRVVRQAVGENNRSYAAGETFETTPSRRAALGGLVEEA